MIIDLQGYGIHNIDKGKYAQFVEILAISNDMLLDLINMQTNIGVVPILCINFATIEKEGPLPHGHHQTKIGIERYDSLIVGKIIVKQ